MNFLLITFLTFFEWRTSYFWSILILDASYISFLILFLFGAAQIILTLNILRSTHHNLPFIEAHVSRLPILGFIGTLVGIISAIGHLTSSNLTPENLFGVLAGILIALITTFIGALCSLWLQYNLDFLPPKDTT